MGHFKEFFPEFRQFGLLCTGGLLDAVGQGLEETVIHAAPGHADQRNQADFAVYGVHNQVQKFPRSGRILLASFQCLEGACCPEPG